MRPKVITGSGNVFADLGLRNPRDRQAKAVVAIHIERLIEESGETQTQAAERMGLAQSDVSKIVNGHLSGFTLDRLFTCLTSLGQDIEISIKSRETGVEQALLHY